MPGSFVLVCRIVEANGSSSWKRAPTTANEVQRLAYLATVMKYLVTYPVWLRTSI